MHEIATEVLIVGAGPTGLALAVALQSAGIDHMLIDALPSAGDTSRAAVIHAHTLEMMEPLGVVSDLVAEGRLVEKLAFRDRDSSLLEADLSQLPSKYPYALMIPQNRTESILAQRLAVVGGEIMREHKAIAIVQDDDGATVNVSTPTGEKIIRAQYVVGADGIHSMVRGSTPIVFEGSTYGQSFILADVRMDWAVKGDEVSMLLSPEGLVVVAPLPDRSTRIVATVDDAPEHASLDFVQSLLNARGPRFGKAQIDHIVWSTRFRVHHRLASSYRHGRLLLMGDAAHVHSPAGGQGMNTGLVDAMVLAQALVSAVRTGKDEALSHYAAIRRPAAKRVLALASRLTMIGTVRSKKLRPIRNAILRMLSHIRPFKRKLTLDLSGLSRKHFAMLPGNDPVLSRPR